MRGRREVTYQEIYEMKKEKMKKAKEKELLTKKAYKNYISSQKN